MGDRGVIVVGAGIGGLTAAAALRREGIEVRVLERAPELLPAGAGLTLHVNATRALGELGLDRPVCDRGVLGQRFRMRDWRGRVLMESHGEALTRDGEFHSVGVHRAAVQEVLMDAVGEVVELGREVAGFEQDPRGVTVRLSDGELLEADAVVGADGIHSRIRAQLHGDEPPRYAGYTCWRGVCPEGALLPERIGSESWGAGRRFGMIPVAEGIYWFATENAPPGGEDGPDPREEVLARFAEFHSPVAEVIRATPSDAIFRADIFDRPPLERWGEGRVTLLGDAAHAMTPNLGQGACQAIEDAVILGRCISWDPSLSTALRTYESARIGRTRRFVRTAWRLGSVAQWENPLARWLRDQAMRLTPTRVAEGNMAWMMDVEV